MLVPDLSVRQSEELFITVRGITGCGSVLESTSNGLIIDSSPPIITILDTSHRALENITSSSTYQTEQTFSSVWTIAEDRSENIDRVSVKIGSYPGGDDLMSESETEVDHIREDISAPEGVPSYVTISARNKAGLESIQHSEPIIMDTSPPEIQFVSFHEHAIFTCTVIKLLYSF